MRQYGRRKSNRRSNRKAGRGGALTAWALAAALALGSLGAGGTLDALAAETEAVTESAPADGSETAVSEEEITSAEEDAGERPPESAVAESAGEDKSTVLLASAGFDYAFSAKKVSLRDVEDRMYDSGVILAKRTESSNGLVLSASAAEAQETEEETEAETSGDTTEGSEETDAAQEAAASETDDASEDAETDGVSEDTETEGASEDAETGSSSEDTDTDSASGDTQTGSTSGDAETDSPSEETGTDDSSGEQTQDGSDASDSGSGDSSADTSAETADEDRAIVETTLTPVQQREQDVVNAVSETQNIEIDSSTATILAATAVSVVSDTTTSVALAEMLDRKQTQAKLDQGVITAVEAEALMAASTGTTAGTADDTSAIASGTDQDSSTESGEDAADETPATDADGNEIIVAQVSDYINIRADASEDAEIVGKLYNGSVATVLGRTGNGWVRIQSGDVYGYIREEYAATGSEAAELAESVATKQAVVTTETLRVRAAPLADSDVISLIAEGETLDILEEVDGWYRVNTVDGEGYISADFADVEEVYPTAVWLEDEETDEEADDSDTDGTSTGTQTTGSSSSSSSGSSTSSALNTYTGTVSTDNASGSQVVAYALQFVGNPYVWGGTSLTNGADCSGFTMAVYAAFGVSLPHNSTSQASCGTAVASLDEAQPGDLIIYSGHVAIYMGNNQIVHASNPANGICTGTATYRTILAIRRIFN